MQLFHRWNPRGSPGNILRMPSGIKFRRKLMVTTALLACSLVEIVGGAFLASSLSGGVARTEILYKIQPSVLYADSSSNFPILYQRHPNADRQSLESGHIARIRQCPSLAELESALKDSVRDMGEVSANGSEFVSLVAPNVAAAALRRKTILTSPSRKLNIRGEGGGDKRYESLRFALFNRIAEALSLPGGQNAYLTIYALVDTLYSLAYFQKANNELDDSKAEKILAPLVISRMDENIDNITRSLRPARLVDILQALQVLGYRKSIGNCFNEYGDKKPPADKIQKQVCHRLLQGDVLAKLSPGDIAIALNILARVIQPLDSAGFKLAIALMRRFRKQAIRQSAKLRQLCRALRAVSKIGLQAKKISIADEDEFDTLYNEAKVGVYTIFKEILQRQASSKSETPEVPMTLQQVVFKELLERQARSKPKTPEDPMTLRQVTEILRSVGSMELWKKEHLQSTEAEDPALQGIWWSFLDAYCQQLFEKASVLELSHFVRAVELTQCNTIGIPPKVLQCLGESSLEEVALITKSEGYCKHKINPKAANAILRCAFHSRGDNATAMEPFLESANRLLTCNEFLAECQAQELTNFLTFLEKTRFLRRNEMQLQDRDDPLLAVGYRILDADVATTFTPAQACHILSSFTLVVMERNKQREECQNNTHDNMHIEEENHVLSDLFQILGEHLLTSNSGQLSPRAISSALCAYAKFSYVQDMGIFDHLACLMAERVEECSVRQVTQSLWACGKMALWEYKQSEDDSQFQTRSEVPALEMGTSSPPYVPSAEGFTAFLSKRADELTPKDISQVIWALGRLQTIQQNKDASSVPLAMGTFVSRARVLSPRLTSQEVANILWGISRAGYEDDKMVHSLTSRLLYLSQSSSPEKPTPQEAASVMYALARMNIQDEEVFDVLTNGILEQLEDASAQAIANALWAHRAVQITPPHQLLDGWATRRLGLVAVQSRPHP